jgi:hypothetical protein
LPFFPCTSALIFPPCFLLATFLCIVMRKLRGEPVKDPCRQLRVIQCRHVVAGDPPPPVLGISQAFADFLRRQPSPQDRDICRGLMDDHAQLVVGQASSSELPKFTDIGLAISNRVDYIMLAQEIPGVPSDQVLPCRLGAPAGNAEPVRGVVEQLPAGLLITVQADKPCYEQATDDRHERGAGEDNRGEERSRVNGHNHHRRCNAGRPGIVVTWLVTFARTETRKTSGAKRARTADLLHAMNHQRGPSRRHRPRQLRKH